MIEGDFAAHFHQDLEQIIRRRKKTGRWFIARLHWLLLSDTLLAAQFRIPPSSTPEPEAEEEEE